MNETPKISVIVPMYNAEKYIKTCINSVLEQTFTDFELLLIDDCSTDKTLEIVKSYSDSRIKIIQNKKNTGNPGLARNIGIEAARGEFLYFIDADDAIIVSALETLYNKIIETDADMVYSCRWMIPNNSEFTELAGLDGHTQVTSLEPVSKDIKLRIWNELCHNHMHSVLWLCLYRRKLFENIRFPNYLAEDVFVHFDLLCATDKIEKIDFPFYIYREHPDSLTHSKKNISKSIEAIMALNNHMRNKLKTLTDDEKFINNVCLSLINGISSIFLQPAYLEDEVKTFHEIEDFFKQNFDAEQTNFALFFLAYLWGQSESIRRTIFKTKLQEFIDQN